jgi:NADPH:quinone reductase-like Zn-dependent oxidoreductase
MKALLNEKYGPPEVLRLVEIPRPQPGQGEVLVRIRAASLNAWDWDLLTGKAFVTRLSGPFRPRYRVLGGDIAGEVAALGPGAAKFQPGQAVFGDIAAHGFGAFAEYAAVPEDALVPKPHGLSFEQAAAIPQAGVLALQGLQQHGPLQPGAEVLINGAGGGAGTFAVQLAKKWGAQVTGVDSAAKLDLMRSLGADHVLDYRQVDFTATGQKYDLILDMVADRSAADYRRALSPTGAFVMVGGTLGAIFKIGALGRLFSHAGGQQLSLLMLQPSPQALAELAQMCLAGEIRPAIDRVYPLSQAAQAFARLGAGEALGKLVFRVEP